MPTIKVPACLENLTFAKDYLKDAVPHAFAEQTQNVLLVAEELLVNVFSYAYPEGEVGEAQISLETEKKSDGDVLVFTVRDWGQPFNPFEEVAEPDLTLDIEARPVGGLGIFLIKQVSSRQSWQYVDGSNLIRIEFRPDEAKESQ